METKNPDILDRRSHAGDAQALIDTAVASTRPEQLDLDALHHVVLPPGSSSLVLDLERFKENPDRKRGQVEHHTGDSLATYVEAHNELDGTTALYADVYGREIVGVLDGHSPANGANVTNAPGWGSHVARLVLRHTPEWQRWSGGDGRLMTQVDFAELIEDRLDDIVEPPGADLLELSKTFEAKTNIAFRSGIVLESGERQLTYVENIDARAGSTGQITIPKEFVLGIAPFEGSALYRVTARLRYRITEGKLGIGYQLVRAEDVLRAAFADTLEAVETATGITAYRGTPPTS